MDWNFKSECVMKQKKEISNEIWKPIECTHGQYEVSNMGRVRSLYIKRNLFGKETVSMCGEIINGSNNGNGYKYFSIRDDNGKRKNIYIHRAVAEAFLKKVSGKNVVNHIDHNKENNNVENLEWCTQRENINHSKHLNRHPKNICNSKTGYKYIYKRKNKTGYRVCIHTYEKSLERHFSKLEHAIAYRNKTCNEFGISI